MALALYRRHRRECKAGHAEDFKTSEYDERKKGWKRCDCPIFVSGSLGKKFGRKTTGQWEWEAAKSVAESYASAQSWDALPAENAAAPPLPTSGPDRVAIRAGVEAYLAKCQGKDIRLTTLAKYRTFSNQLLAFSDKRGYNYLDQFTVADMDQFYASWKDGVRAKARKLHRLKTFVKFCLKRKWLAEDITSDLEPPAGSSTVNPKSPLTDAELGRLYAACDRILPTLPGKGYRDWTGEDARDFIDLSVYTGLRISDVATFDITKRLSGNDVFLRMHKTQRPLFTWIPDWLVARLRAREKAHGALIFKCGVAHTMKQLTATWREKRLAKVFALAGPWEEDRLPTPHQFRHTFVRILLERGVPSADVAELIGDTEAVLRKHYAAWIPARQARLSNILRSAFEDRARSGVSAIA